ncbi:cell division regulator GpsB [Pullulanibacillus sp. KACC 23026]|uniref:cell division regulator GpsB n=1 Tax=Pullulanibacillus sp. KACC 23026 TaxID=3028315 RepID=UPI0023B10A5B|nr:cell division regulator GpsB [Pullulanibacillus sp. KACC 23026]WEG14945.1 cell division regulator GpsB [Pullulanibacillus sp. KACC 23026]
MGLENRVVQLTTKDILEKEFKSGLRGYSPDEVDQFLDVIIKDYEAFEAEIQRLRQENQKLKQDMTQQPVESRRSSLAQGQTNYDILKRLSNLEKHVFGSRLND